MNKPNELITDVDGQVYLIQSASTGNGFFFTPCTYIDRITIYSVENIQEIITTQSICLIEDEELIRKLIGLHIRIKQPIGACNSASANLN